MRLVVIWVLFFAYIALIYYFFIQYGSNESGDLTPPPTADSLLVKPGEADSLLAEFFKAYEAGNYDRARALAEELGDKYPGSEYANRAAEIIAAIDAEQRQRKPEDVPPRITYDPTSRVVSPPPAKTTPPPRTTKPKPPRPSREDRLARERMIRESEALVRDALGKLRRVRDDQSGITRFYNANVSHYVYKNSFEAYIGQSDQGDVWLRMRIYYHGDKPLNIESYEINVDDKDYPISTLYGNRKRGQGPGGYWEWYDAQVSPKEVAMMEKVMEPGPTAIRYFGSSGNFERMMTEPEKLRLKYIMDAYHALRRLKEYLISANLPPAR